jgi:hypothetical protein
VRDTRKGNGKGIRVFSSFNAGSMFAVITIGKVAIKLHSCFLIDLSVFVRTTLDYEELRAQSCRPSVPAMRQSIVGRSGMIVNTSQRPTMYVETKDNVGGDAQRASTRRVLPVAAKFTALATMLSTL